MTKLSIKIVHEDEFELVRKWDEYVQNHPEATIYHFYGWREIYKEGLGYASTMLMAVNESETSQEVVGILPLFLVNGFFSSRYVSVPFRDRGGILWSSDDAFKQLIDYAKSLVSDFKVGSLVLKSIREWPLGLFMTSEMSKSVYWVNSKVSLLEHTPDLLWRKLGSKTRNMIRQAEGSGILFEDKTNNTNVLDEWQSLHLITQKRLGVPPFPRRFFELMFLELKRINAIKVFVVTKNGKPISGMLMFIQKNMAIYGYSASTEDAQKMRANDFMIYNALNYLIEQKIDYFDMGSDSPQQDSLLFFKKKWGALQTAIPFYGYGKSGSLEIDSSSSKYHVVRKLFRALPTSTLNLIGNHLTKYFG